MVIEVSKVLKVPVSLRVEPKAIRTRTLLEQLTRRMALEHLDGLELPAAADMHVHLRDGAMMELVVYALK